MSGDDTIVLTCASDEGYAPYATTMLLSALENTPGARFRVHYLCTPDFSAHSQALIRQSLRAFEKRLELNFIPVPDALVAGLPLFKTMKAGEIRPVMWYRVFLPRLLPDEPKILYLDCDILVVGSLKPLWRTALAGKALAAVTNPFWDSPAELAWASRCGLERREDYFNSGVMLLNLDWWRREDITGKVISHGLANADWTRFGDQDSLVAVLHAARLPLAPRWNAMRMLMMANQSRVIFSAEELHEAIRHPAIIHFEGSTKPWVDPSKHPYGRLHARYARRLPWPVTHTPWTLLDLENLLTRLDWPRLRARVRGLRQRLAARA